MKHLTFERAARGYGSRSVRGARFAERSLLPSSAACVVGNAVRETLGALLHAPVAVRLLEPIVPGEQAWLELLRDARTLRVRGSVCEGAVVVRPGDARALAAAAFGEGTGGTERLSPLETIVLERILAALAPSLSSVCGAELQRAGDGSPCAFSTYFEALIERPNCRIGIALSHEPPAQTHGTLRPNDLAGVPLTLRAVLGEASLTAGELAALRPGVTLPVAAEPGGAALRLEGRRVAGGVCGARAGRFAVLVAERAPL